MSVGVYIPSGLQSPEIEILLAKAQAEIEAKEDVILITCPGTKSYACAFNPYGHKLICNYCKSRRDSGISKLNGKFEVIETPPISQKLSEVELAGLLKNKKAIKSYMYKNTDAGQAAYASYLSVVRDQDLEGALHQKSMQKLLETTTTITSWLFKIIPEKNITKLIIYSGRLNNTKPFLTVGKQLKINVEIMEFCGNKADCVWQFENDLVQKIPNLAKAMDNCWNNFDSTKEQKSAEFYAMKKSGGAMQDKSYVLAQEENKLPKTWDFTKHNVVIFNSSEDEFAALGEEYDDTLYSNQLAGVSQICESLLSDSDTKLWLRMHPNLSGVNWSFAQQLRKIGDKYPNITVIQPESKISTYALMDACNIAVTFGSTITVESAYGGKPTVLLGRCVYELQGSAYVPKNHAEAVKLIQNKNLKPLPILGAQKTALFLGWGGHSIPYFTGDRTSGFKINNQAVKVSAIKRKLYLFSKVIERIKIKYSAWRKV